MEGVVWMSPTRLCPAWLKEACGIECLECVVLDLSNKISPRSCLLLQLQPPRANLVLKQLPSDERGTPLPDKQALSARLGYAREGCALRAGWCSA